MNRPENNEITGGLLGCLPVTFAAVTFAGGPMRVDFSAAASRFKMRISVYETNGTSRSIRLNINQLAVVAGIMLLKVSKKNFEEHYPRNGHF